MGRILILHLGRPGPVAMGWPCEQNTPVLEGEQGVGLERAEGLTWKVLIKGGCPGPAVNTLP